MNKYGWLGLFCLVSLNLQAQNQYSFQVLIDPFNPVSIPMPVTLEVNGARVTSNNDGLFRLYLKTSDRYITVQSTDPAYRITFPPNGTVFLPVNPADIPQIMMGMPGKQQTTREAILILKQLDSVRHDLKQAKVANLDQELLKRQDSLLSVARKKYAITDADLRTAREVMEGRERNFSRISTALNNYLNQAKNLRDALEQLGRFALDNPKAFRLLDSTIYLYSAAYDSINSNHVAWQQAIRNYWFSGELALGFQNVTDFTLNDLHREYFLTLNEDIIRQINAYLNESNRKKKKALRETVISSINSVLPHLDSRLAILDTKTNMFLSTMQSMNNDYQAIVTSNQ